MKRLMTEDGPVESAVLHGYLIGDRLLEGVVFVITIDADGEIVASTHPSSKDYISDLNEKKWLKAAVSYAKQVCEFEHPVRRDEPVWIEDDCAVEAVTPTPVEVKCVFGTDLFGLFERTGVPKEHVDRLKDES